jgi:hypothetical protein
MLSKMAKSPNGAGSSKAPASKVAKAAKASKVAKVAKTGKSKNGKSKGPGSKVLKKPLVVVKDDTLELPLVVYKLTMKEMVDITTAFHVEAVGGEYQPAIWYSDIFADVNISVTPEKMFEAIGMTPEQLGPELAAKFLTILREHEDQSVVDPIEDLDEDEEVSTEHMTKQPYDVKELYALFFLYEEPPGEGMYQYIKIKIAASTIKKAGMGIYTLEDIPDGAVGQYKGIPRVYDDTNMYYSWVVKSFDPLEGLPDETDTYMYYIDATDFDRSNWTRYVNCGMAEVDNNMDQEQVYDKIFYTVTRDIEAGEELFVDYGEEYRVWNFGMEEGVY